MTRQVHVKPSVPFVERFYFGAPIRPADGCWPWQRGTTGERGYIYGTLSAGNNRRVQAHRAAYELFVAPIPEGMQIHHLCENTLCVNPDHLEAVTPQVHRAERHPPQRKDVCRKGHPMGEYGGMRRCATCARERNRNYMRRKTGWSEEEIAAGQRLALKEVA